MQNFDIFVYVVGTPIGNLADVSKRAILTLQSVDCILCEDTRVSAKLLQHLGIQKQLAVYNDHNASRVVPRVINDIKENNTKYALISDAGMPLISDPGYKLINACIENGVSYTTIPGPSSVISALIMSGMPSSQFTFCGFADPKKFDQIAEIPSTIIMFESPKRLLNTLKQIKVKFPNRMVAVVKEITKIFEQVVRGHCDVIIEHFQKEEPKGEFVIVIEPPTIDNEIQKLENAKNLIQSLRGHISDSELSLALSKYLQISKNTIYNFMKNNSE